jgi:hypothetical protein
VEDKPEGGWHMHIWVRVPLAWKHPVTQPGEPQWAPDAAYFECAACGETGYRIPAVKAEGVSRAV